MSNKLSMEQVYNFVNDIAGRHNEIKALLEQATVLQNQNAHAINDFVAIIVPPDAVKHDHDHDHHDTAGPTPVEMPSATPMPTPAQAPSMTHGPGHHPAHQPTAATFSAPVSVDTQQPTPVGQAVAKPNALGSAFDAMHEAVNKLSKTTGVDAEPNPAPVKSVLDEMREGWHGPRSIFAQLLSPSAYTGGRGFLSPSTSQIYNEDVMKTPLKTAINWPTGFYTDGATKEVQFFLNLPSVAVFVEKLPSCVGDVWIAFKTPQGVTDRVNINAIFAEHQMKFALDCVWAYLQEQTKA